MGKPAPQNIDPQAIRSVATFNFTKKVRGPAEFPLAIDAILAPLVSSFEKHGFSPGGTRIHPTGLSQAVLVAQVPFVLTVACQEPVAYEWALWVDAMPGFLARLFNRPPPALKDSAPLRSLLGALDQALKSDANFTALGWHKKETVTHTNLSSRADVPFA